MPQGGGKLPTIALVECLAEEGSRTEAEYCRTTYECSPTRDGTGVSGTLWEGLTYHDGRRVTLATDQIANQRSCKLTVEDDAKITYYTADRPDGLEGEIVAFTRIGSAASTSTIGTFTVPAANMLGPFLSHNAVGTATLGEWTDSVCADIEDEGEQGRCRVQNGNAGFYLEGIAATEKTACYVEAEIAYGIQQGDPRREWLGALVNTWSTTQDRRRCKTSQRTGDSCNTASTIG